MTFMLSGWQGILVLYAGYILSSQAITTTAFAQTDKPFKVIETFEVGQNVVVRALAVDGSNYTLWVGTSVGIVEVDYRSGVIKQTYTRDNGLANEYVFAALVDSKQQQWFGTNGGGVSHLTKSGWKTYFPMHGLGDYWVYAFAERNDEEMWIGTWRGISVFHRKTGKFKNYLAELVNEWVYGLAVDAQERVWIGTEGGVNRFDGHEWVVWTHQDDGLGAPNTQQLLASTNTGLGTRERHNLEVSIAGKETYNPSYIFCLQVDPLQHVWAGTWGGGVSRFDGQTWTNYTVADGLAGNIVYSMAQDNQGGLWFGTNHGLSYRHQDQWHSYAKPDGLLDEHIYAVAVTPEGDVWAGMKQGVAKLVKHK